MTKRPYLGAAERRRHLLDATGRIFDRSGFGITMVAVAKEANVSRRLVYDHFAGLEGLYVAFVEDRLARYRAALPDLTALPLDEAALATFRHLLTIPPADRRVVRLLVAGAPGLERVRERFRLSELARWGDVPPKGRRGRLATAIIWTTSSALLALADAVTDGDITETEAEAVAVQLVRSVSSAMPGRDATLR